MQQLKNLWLRLIFVAQLTRLRLSRPNWALVKWRQLDPHNAAYPAFVAYLEENSEARTAALEALPHMEHRAKNGMIMLLADSGHPVMPL